ncbi:MAG TPA: Uma2 family endonuclease [Thermoanaerobaculia bacterium]|jgi:Uma2 family endonuclease|nr:Uma2 family endonuclease [Thermoanaerobaculia bacterium]
MAIQNPKRLISIDDYHRMAADGLFAEDDRVELIDGEIVEMTAIGNPHASGVRRLGDFLSTALGRRVLVDTQNPLLLGEWSEPQPDLTVLPRRADYYLSAAPTAQDALLVVEIADSSVAYDRKVKGPLYARHEVREYWLLDLPAKVLEVYRRPSPDGYREVRRLRRGDTVALEAFPEVMFAVSDLLGPVD